VSPLLSASAEQVLRFAVGTPSGPRSGTWRLWVPPSKSDLYLSPRALGAHVKVSLHESGSWRLALTREYVERTSPQPALPGGGRVMRDWQRPDPQPGTAPFTQAFAIVVPWFEVVERPRERSSEGVLCRDHAGLRAPAEQVLQERVFLSPSSGRTRSRSASKRRSSVVVGSSTRQVS
jgi:hypothetical protein